MRRSREGGFNIECCSFGPNNLRFKFRWVHTRSIYVPAHLRDASLCAILSKRKFVVSEPVGLKENDLVFPSGLPCARKKATVRAECNRCTNRCLIFARRFDLQSMHDMVSRSGSRTAPRSKPYPQSKIYEKGHERGQDIIQSIGMDQSTHHTE